MARRHAHLQNAATKGELDPLLYERTDLKHYYNALKTALNVEMLPQGGFRRRAGQASISRLRRRIEPIILTAGMLAAPNGGTAANLIDGTASALVTNAVTGTDFVAATVDLGSPKAVAFVDLIGFSAALVTEAAAATLDVDNNMSGGIVCRQHIPAAAFSTGGDAVRLSLTGKSTSSEGESFVLNCFIGKAAPGTDPDFAEPPVRVTFNGGSPSVSLGDGGAPTVVSDIVPFSLDASADHIVSFDMAGNILRQGLATGWTAFVKNAATEAHLVDVSGYTSVVDTARILSKIEVGFGKQDVLTVEYETTPGTWVPFSPGVSGDPLAYRDISAGSRTRRFGLVPGSTVTAQKWRINVHNGSGSGALSLQELRFWAETAARSKIDFLSFAASIGDVYIAVAGADNIDLFRVASTWVAAARSAIPDDLVTLAGWLQSEDTGLLLNEDYQPLRLTRQAGDNEWNVDFPGFANVPLLSASTVHLASRFAQQHVEITGLATNDVIAFRLRDSFCAPITYSGSLTAGDIETAIEAAPNVDADGVTVTNLSIAGSALVFDVAFINNNGAQHWPRLVPYVLGNAAAAATVTVIQEGVPGTTPLMGAKTGWPRCGILTQARLVLAGFKTFPSILAASVNGSLFDVRQASGSLALATDAIVNKLDSDQVETIRAVGVGTHLSFFTDSGEWYAEARTLNATQPLNLVRPTGNGIAAGTPPVAAEGGLLFVQAGSDDEAVPIETQGSVLRFFQFGGDASQASYAAEPLSLLGPHLLTGVTHMAWRRGRKTDEGGLVFMVNADGSLPVMTFLRAQEVVSLAKHTTDGPYRAVTVDVRRDVHFAVERTVGGTTDNWLERRDPARLLDASVTRTLVSSNVVTGLAHLEGKSNVWAIAGGNPYGPFTVTGAQITLPLPATFSGEVEAGLFFPVIARTLPLRPELPNDARFKPPGRCYKLVVSVVNSGGFAVSANGQPPRTIVCRDPSAPLTDTPMMEALFTGDVEIEDLEGWTKDVEVEISQPTPAPLTVRSLRMEVAY